MKDTLFDTFSKVLTLVDRSTRWQAIGMLVIVIFGVALETLSIGMIFPFIMLMIDPGKIQAMPWLVNILPGIDGEIENVFLIQLTVGLLGLFVLKGLVLLAVYYTQAYFSIANMRLLALRLYRCYLHGPYSLHLTRNSADLIQNIHAASSATFVGSFMGFLTLASETLLLLAVVALLIIIDPITTVGAGVAIGGSMSIFYMIFKRRIRYWGERTLESAKSILKALQQGLHSIKEIKVLGRENFVLDDYRGLLDEYVHLITVKQVMVQAPRLWIETVTVSTILVVILYVLTSGDSAQSLLPLLTVFAAGAIRLIPSMNRILIALNRINDAKFSVDEVHRDLMALKADQDDMADDAGAGFSFSDALGLENVSFHYPNANSPALHDIDLTLRQGESLGLVGPSGAGKTTLVDIILGLLKPTNGRILVDGRDVASAPRAWQRQLGYVPQTIYLIDDTLRRNIALGLEDKEIEQDKIDNAIRLASVDEFIPTLPDGLETNVGEHGVRLSGGQRQRVGIARALYRNPEVLILDEATSSLDSETEHEISKAIDHLSAEKTVIIIAHRLSTVRKCDRLVFLEEGHIADAGTFDDLAERNEAFKNLVELSRL